MKDGGGAALASYDPDLAGASEAAMTFGELYRRNDEWKFRAVGQGFNGGLGPLARSFGIDVKDEAPPAPPPAPPAPASPLRPQRRRPPAAPAAPISLSKVSLEKKGQAISLEKKGSSFGEIVINLNWTRGKKGFFGGGTAIDLDLGCLIEMADGQKGVVQALGRSFGDYHGPPFIQLDGDDRTGDVSQGETMRINGAQWQRHPPRRDLRQHLRRRAELAADRRRRHRHHARSAADRGPDDRGAQQYAAVRRGAAGE